MDEYEIVVYAFYLDKLKWKKDSNYTIEEFLSIIALFVKLRLKKNSNSYISYIEIENQDLITKLKDFLEIKNENKYNFSINHIEQNDKFKELSKVY